jgi:hypothetical protein
MRRIASTLLCLALVAGLVACATPHTIRMRDGRTISTKDEPKPDKETGFYVFEDEEGKKVRVNKDEIVEIRPK